MTSCFGTTTELLLDERVSVMNVACNLKKFTFGPVYTLRCWHKTLSVKTVYKNIITKQNHSE